MSLKECLISLQFDKLHIPVIKVPQCIINISYEDKLYRINYPQEQPLIFPLTSPVEKEKNVIFLRILIPAGKKFRKLAKGYINVYRKYFLNEKFTFEKYLYLTVNQTQIEQMTYNTDIIKSELNSGQIQVKAKFYDPQPKELATANKKEQQPPVVIENYKLLKAAFVNVNRTRENLSVTSTDRFRSIVEGSNKCLRDIKRGRFGSDEIENLDNSIKDDLSDFSVSEIDPNEDGPIDYHELNEQSLNLLDSMKEYLEKNAKGKKVSFPKEKEKQDALLNSLNTECIELSNKYEKIIKNVKEMNLDLKHKAKDLYVKYKVKKVALKKQRKELNNKNLFLQNEIKVNKEMNQKQQDELKEIEADTFHISQSPLLKPTERDEDTNMMIDILMDFINNNGETEINKGLNAYQKSRLKSILASRELLEGESERYIAAIEDEVNKSYQQKLIHKIKVEQVSTKQYMFDDKEVVLSFNNAGKLEVSPGLSFEEWLIISFPLPVPVPLPLPPPILSNTKKENNSSGKKENKKEISSSSSAKKELLSGKKTH